MKKTALIIGASSDIASAFATLLSTKGFNLILTYRDRDKLQINDKEKKEKLNKESIFFDIEDINYYDVFIKNLNVTPDIIFFAIGLLNSKDDLDSSKTLEKLINVNFVYPAIFINQLMNKLKNSSKKIKLVALTSVAGERGRAKNYIYGSAKAGLTTFLSGLRQKFSNSNISVMTVKLGFVQTKMTENLEMPNFLSSDPEEIANLIFKAYQKDKNIIYSKYWRLIMALVRIIPEKIFKKLNF
tara:strand:- start:15529 stop:16254 length:726 start_codon:yes stop_codon:yes gene_type:complete